MAKYLNLKPVDYDKLSAKRKEVVRWTNRILLPKYDGCLALVGFWNGKPDFILSRDGKAVKSMDHVYDDLLSLYPGIKEDRPGERGWCFLGEAWNPGKPFAELSGTFRRQRPQPGLGFAPFDLVSYRIAEDNSPLLYSGHPYHERLAGLMSSIASPTVYPPKPIICENERHALRYARNLKALGGYDGCVASDPDATYTVSDGYGEFLKVKPLKSFSLRVVGYEAAIGSKTGRATGALVVTFKRTTCKVATGLSEAEQANLAQFVGSIIEVGCMDVYEGEDGLMREPRYLGVREDVITPDF